MKVLVILGSRNPEGQTARAAAALAMGAQAEGAEVAGVPADAADRALPPV